MRIHINPKNAFENKEVCAVSDKPASNKGILRILVKKEYLVIAYKHTEDLNLVYNKSPYPPFVRGGRGITGRSHDPCFCMGDPSE